VILYKDYSDWVISLTLYELKTDLASRAYPGYVQTSSLSNSCNCRCLLSGYNFMFDKHVYQAINYVAPKHLIAHLSSRVTAIIINFYIKFICVSSIGTCINTASRFYDRFLTTGVNRLRKYRELAYAEICYWSLDSNTELNE
jgi:hypothetical protein